MIAGYRFVDNPPRIPSEIQSEIEDRSTVYPRPTSATDLVVRAMALVKESVTDRHQFHAGSDGIRGPGLVGLKTRWTCPVKIRELITMTQFTLRVSVDTGLMAYITDLVERAIDH